MPIISINEVGASNVDPAVKALLVAAQSARDNVTAFAGGGQSGATQITDMVTRVTTVATAADSVRLPRAVLGLELTVINAAAANAMNVFPASGDAINALSADTALSCAAAKTIKFIGTGSGRWHSMLTA
jgi:hypothetical protein